MRSQPVNLQPGTQFNTHEVAWHGRKHRIVEFDVANEPMSFHHPLAWLWAEILKDVDTLAADNLRRAGLPDLGSLYAQVEFLTPFMYALEQPIQSA